MEEHVEYDGVSILDVLGIELCAREIFEHVPVRDLVRSEHVSRRWQRAVLDYLLGCRNLHLHNTCISSVCNTRHRTIPIKNTSDPNTLSMLYQIVIKLGSSIVKLTTNKGSKSYVEIFATYCLNLQHIEFCNPFRNTNRGITIFGNTSYKWDVLNNITKLKQISLTSYVISDERVSRPFRAIECEKIEIYDNFTLNGSFLKHIQSNALKSLSLHKCPSLEIYEILPSVKLLRNLTSLELNRTNTGVLEYLHLILKEVPKLENLSLRKYVFANLSDSFIESISQLGNLKRLDMMENYNVSDELLKALARGCGRLEHLNIRSRSCNSQYGYCYNGVLALCHRGPRAVTTLSMDYIKNFTSEDVAKHILRHPVVGCLRYVHLFKVTPQWMEAVARASQGRQYLLELTTCTGVEDKSNQLKIIL